MHRPRHIVSAIVLLGMSAFATWNAANNGDLADPVLPVVSGLAVIWLAAGLGSLSGTSVGAWIGRLGAAVLIVFGVYVGWNNIVDYSGPESWRVSALLIALPLTGIFVGAGVGVLVALRRMPGSHSIA